MNILSRIFLVLIIIGAINWGLVGIFDFDLVSYLFKEGSLISRIIYTIIGLSGIVNLILLFKPNNIED